MSFLDFPGLQYFYNKYLKPIKPHAREETIKSYTVNEQGHVPDAQLVVQLKEENESLQEEIEKLNSALADNLNQNRIELTNSSYYPAAVCYRSGQTVYMKCAGTLEKEVPADSPLVVGIESMMPKSYRPNANIVAYPNISLGGKQIKLEIMATGRVVFTSPEKLPVGFGLNMHFSYMTGKSNF